MIVLLNCSINLYANDVVTPNDSVMISYDDLRIVNSKLIELKYEKEINNNLKQIVTNDEQIISNYKVINDNIIKDCKKVTTQRNVLIGVSVTLAILSIILLVK